MQRPYAIVQLEGGFFCNVKNMFKSLIYNVFDKSLHAFKKVPIKSEHNL